MKFNVFNLYEIRIKRNPFRKKWYKEDYLKFRQQMGNNSDFKLSFNFPCLNDRSEDSGVISGAYFHQDLYVAKKIYQDNPAKHVDVGSRIDGFVAHVAVYREIEIFDIRKLESKVKNIIFKQADLTSENFQYTDYAESVSCLHALEHFGLGRYGDTIDVDGHIKGFNNISKIVKKTGRFYFSVPMGNQRIEFNAHRIFSIKYLIDWVSKDFNIDSFSYVDDMGDFHEKVELTKEGILTNFNCNHGCAIFVLIKK